MRSILKLVVTLSILAAWSCAHGAAPIRLEGRPEEWAALAGTWAGSYEGEGTLGRRGSIRFTLEAAEGHAHGDVFMTPLGATRPFERYRAGEPISVPREAPETLQPLTIQFVRVEDGMVKGTLDAYWDPDRQCEAYTTFLGRVYPDRIEGTFRTTFSRPAADATGQWVVKRNQKR